MNKCMLINSTSILTRRAIEWEKFLESIINTREEKDMKPKLKKPQLERIILHHFSIQKIKEDMINLQIKEREKKWMNG